MNTLLQRLLLCVATTIPLSLFSQATVRNVSNTSSSTTSSLRVERLGDNVNTANADMAPFRYADKLYFTSTVKEPKSEKTLSRVFTVLPDGAAQVFEANPENDRTHMAQTAVTITGDRMYFTLYRGNANYERDGKIWYRERNYDGNWSHLKRIPEPVNINGQQNTMPATGIFRDTRENVLFFVSDRPGGKGGLDIWFTVLRNDGTYSEPVNLPFNTPEDDVTPYFNVSDQTLYFSSKGHNGLGGFDVFQVAKLEEHTWSEPKNLGHLVNSDFDELYFTYHDGSKTVYFSSDRPNESCPPSNPSCRDFDIYQLKVTSDEKFNYTMLE